MEPQLPGQQGAACKAVECGDNPTAVADRETGVQVDDLGEQPLAKPRVNDKACCAMRHDTGQVTSRPRRASKWCQTVDGSGHDLEGRDNNKVPMLKPVPEASQIAEAMPAKGLGSCSTEAGLSRRRST